VVAICGKVSWQSPKKLRYVLCASEVDIHSLRRFLVLRRHEMVCSWQSPKKLRYVLCASEVDIHCLRRFLVLRRHEMASNSQ
jgi:hypothetical protein